VGPISGEMRLDSPPSSQIVLRATGALSHEWRENTHADCCVYCGCRNKETYVTQRVLGYVGPLLDI
jgi:hypothetical protein